MALPSFVDMAFAQNIFDVTGPQGEMNLAKSGLGDRGERFKNVRRYINTIVQTVFSVDAAVAEALSTFYLYVKNNDGSDRSLTFNNQSFVFAAGKVHAIRPGEASFYMTQAQRLGYNFTYDTQANFIANGVVRSFYW